MLKGGTKSSRGINAATLLPPLKITWLAIKMLISL